jgi:hypothetical protein
MRLPPGPSRTFGRPPNRKRRRQPAFFESMSPPPEVRARRIRGKKSDFLEVTCPYCGRRHKHGAGLPGSPIGAGDGHRFSHCGDGSRTPGYIVVEEPDGGETQPSPEEVDL